MAKGGKKKRSAKAKSKAPVEEKVVIPPGVWRFKVLLVIGIAIIIADQWTKFLAVKHVTPGIALQHLETKQGQKWVRDREHQDELLSDISFFGELSYFYFDVRGPCSRSRRLCPDMKVIDGFWSWRYAENKGAAWSLFAKLGDSFRVPFLAGVSIIAVFFIISFIRKLDDGQRVLIIALSLICGGAVGNLIDRVYLGYVIDFIHWYWGRSAWPTFNVADAAISTGVGLILLNSLLEMIAKRKEDKEQEPLPDSAAQP